MFSDISDEKSHQLIVILLYKSKIESLGSDCHWKSHVQPLSTFLLLATGKHHLILNWYESKYFLKIILDDYVSRRFQCSWERLPRTVNLVSILRKTCPHQKDENTLKKEVKVLWSGRTYLKVSPTQGSFKITLAVGTSIEWGGRQKHVL